MACTDRSGHSMKLLCTRVCVCVCVCVRVVNSLQQCVLEGQTRERRIRNKNNPGAILQHTNRQLCPGRGLRFRCQFLVTFWSIGSSLAWAKGQCRRTPSQVVCYPRMRSSFPRWYVCKYDLYPIRTRPTAGETKGSPHMHPLDAHFVRQTYIIPNKLNQTLPWLKKTVPSAWVSAWSAEEGSKTRTAVQRTKACGVTFLARCFSVQFGTAKTGEKRPRTIMVRGANVCLKWNF